jgi:hypothetical protein
MRGIHVLDDEELTALDILPRYAAILSGADTNAIRRQWERILNQRLPASTRTEIVTLTQLLVRVGILEDDET